MKNAKNIKMKEHLEFLNRRRVEGTKYEYMKSVKLTNNPYFKEVKIFKRQDTSWRLVLRTYSRTKWYKVVHNIDLQSDQEIISIIRNIKDSIYSWK